MARIRCYVVWMMVNGIRHYVTETVYVDGVMDWAWTDKLPNAERYDRGGAVVRAQLLRAQGYDAWSDMDMDIIARDIHKEVRRA